MWSGSVADLAKVYDSGWDCISAIVFGRDEGWLVLGGFIPVVFHSGFDQRVVLFEEAMDW